MIGEPPQSVRVTNAELATVREAMRDLNRLLDQLDQGELEKVVLTQRNQMRAVLVTVERYSELERNAA
jgi:PHD/YefM family antitoxin component YafN of YafNO toxin-antitoxin module